MRILRSIFLLTLIVSGMPVPAFAGVDLTAEQRADLGIRTEPFREMTVARHWPASGQVLDTAPLISSLSDLNSAETAAGASRDEAQRAERLYREDQNVARKALDAARSQAATDRARVMTLKGQLLASWGRGITDLSSSASAQLIEELLAGRASLVRADQFQAVAGETRIKDARVTALSGQESWTAQWLGVLPQTTGATLAGAALLRVPAGLPAGQPLTVDLLGAAGNLTALSAPAASVIRWHGVEWVYHEATANHFERVEVQGAHVDGRVILAGDKHPAGNVVTVGARSLLGAELGASDASNADKAQ